MEDISMSKEQAAVAMTLDRSRPFNEVLGHELIRYNQGGVAVTIRTVVDLAEALGLTVTEE
jgi:acyl-coenzyme A thioesterase PaaI-like protein